MSEPSGASSSNGKQQDKKPQRPQPSSGAPSQAESSTQRPAGSDGTSEGATKKKRHRAGKKKRKNRRQSFAAPSEGSEASEPFNEPLTERTNLQDVPEHQEAQPAFYQLGNRATRSNTSLDSDVLLDHRQLEDVPVRRPSLLQQAQAQRIGHLNPLSRFSHSQSGGTDRSPDPSRSPLRARTWGGALGNSRGVADADNDADDRTPLLHSIPARQSTSRHGTGYAAFSSRDDQEPSHLRRRRTSVASSVSRPRLQRQMSNTSVPSYDVNNPPSVPGSPTFEGAEHYDDVTIPEFAMSESPISRRGTGYHGREAVIDVDRHDGREGLGSPSRSPPPDYHGGFRRRQSIQSPILDDDVCVPFDRMTDIAEEEDVPHHDEDPLGMRRSRKRPWPDLDALEEWSQEEKEERTMNEVRAKKVNEPVIVEGRLRPRRGDWRREEDEAPFRWTYFNEELDSSLRSHTISGLQQLGLSFRELFIPDPPEIEDDSSDEDDEPGYGVMADRAETPVNGHSRAGTRQSSILDAKGQPSPGEQTPSKERPAEPRRKKYGPRPVFWLDVLQPTYEEMRVISRAFGIHKLTAEDIMEQETREKVELFRNYYFVNYRTFEQDQNSEDYMEPVNFYFVVFKGGVISFHFSQLPHPPNVRRRIRQLAEHQYTDSDWISYAIIDNITDAYAPTIEQIEEEVDKIDEDILQMHRQADARSRGEKKPSSSSSASGGSGGGSSGGFLSRFSLSRHGKVLYEKLQNDPEPSPVDMGRDMLLRVGECRKRVMGLYRLLGNKADVIKGLAKRCNEQWQVAPRSDVGMYLGDIQDHIVTMTGNLTHYENILARSHSNYLAQINIGMNERAEKTADVLGKLTVLGTIVLPMNIITGMWGMNVEVPGQYVENLDWFWCITAGLVLFGITCFFVAKKVYGIV